MKKIFIAIFCGITVANISSAFAEVRSIVDIGAQPMNDRSMSPQEAISPDLPDPNNEEEVSGLNRRGRILKSVRFSKKDLKMPLFPRPIRISIFQHRHRSTWCTHRNIMKRKKMPISLCFKRCMKKP